MIILAIETSCDETAVAILKCQAEGIEILSNIVASQVKIHSQWGGVVPRLAKREHQANLIPVLIKALREAKLLKSKFPPRPVKTGRGEALASLRSRRSGRPDEHRDGKILNSILSREPELAEKLLRFLEEHQKPKIDVIAVTQGPGLEPTLWTGINFAKSLAVAWDKPLTAVNHLEGHIASVLLKQNRGSTKHEARSTKRSFEFRISNFGFPIVALLVSGGHTQLVLVNPPAGGWLEYKIIGETLDDAAGECFDKVARMLGLGYPGGPVIAAYAAKSQISNLKSQIKLPRPMLNSKDYNFSFSGLKTAALYKIKELKRLTPKLKIEIAVEFQQAVIDVLIKKTLKAAKNFKTKTIILGGGVAANKELRKQLKFSVKKELPDSILLLPEIKFTGDNAAMIALAAYFRAKKKEYAALSKLKADGNLKLR